MQEFVSVGSVAETTNGLDVTTASRSASEILQELAGALPMAAVLLDEHGRVLWISHAAQARLSAVARARRAPTVAVAGELAACSRVEAAATRASPHRVPRSLLVPRVERSRAPTPLSVASNAATALRPSLGLSARETEVALLAAEGFSVLNIASRLEVSESTVRTHLKRLYRKLGVCSRVELARRVYRGPD